MNALEDCGQHRVACAIVITAGFGESGADGRTSKRAFVIARVRSAYVLVGPNRLGALNTDDAVPHMRTSLTRGRRAETFAVCQYSGALGLAVLDFAQDIGSDFVTS